MTVIKKVGEMNSLWNVWNDYESIRIENMCQLEIHLHKICCRFYNRLRSNYEIPLRFLFRKGIAG